MNQNLTIIQTHPIVPLSRMGFPDEILSKYQLLEPAYTRSGDEEVRNFPLIKHAVSSTGIRQFAVKDAEGNTLGEFTQEGCNQAFMAACRYVEELGKPWKVSNGSLVFDPASGRCWTTYLEGRETVAVDVAGA